MPGCPAFESRREMMSLGIFLRAWMMDWEGILIVSGGVVCMYVNFGCGVSCGVGWCWLVLAVGRTGRRRRLRRRIHQIYTFTLLCKADGFSRFINGDWLKGLLSMT